ncbi:STAS domain-containing protein [Kitasatospora sp. MBT63]|uniref:STAS domain-containing protein n=1 Tax=Kitasatospora sp. MBT63 TaxID=1444768 RepID=UPI0021015183|nr:STAS domain-containing protein [Kitasatospora sp. MBT63]
MECAGELDLEQAPVLHAAVHRALALRPVPPILVIDLGAVTFCDSAGLNVLLRGRIEAERLGAAVHLARPTANVARLLQLTGTDQLFPVEPAGLSVPHHPSAD